MNDLSALLDATQATTCEFLGTEIKLDVYTAGVSRLTHEESKEFREVVAKYEEPRNQSIALRKQIEALESQVDIDGNADDSLTKLRAQLNEIDTGDVETMRVVVPMMLAGWSLNGEPMKRDGQDFPPTRENITKIPDPMLLAVGSAATDVWQNPMPPVSESGSAQTENLDNSQTETTTPLAASD